MQQVEEMNQLQRSVVLCGPAMRAAELFTPALIVSAATDQTAHCARGGEGYLRHAK